MRIVSLRFSKFRTGHQAPHLTVLAGLSRVFQRGVIMSDAFCVIGTNKGFVQKLSFLVRHIGDQQTEKYVELLDLCCKFR